MGSVLNMQLTAFCNYRIEPNVKNIMVLMEQINSLGGKEFLPNIITGQNIDLIKGNVETISNLRFVTIDNSGQIICQDNRIDCILNFTSKNQGSLNDIAYLQKIIRLIMKEYEIISNRMAWNIDLLSDFYDSKLQNTSFGQNVVSTLDFYKEKELKEWSFRENMWYPIRIAENKEILNVITELRMVTSNSGDEKRLLCHMDINTIPERTGYRFDEKKVEEFVEEVKKIVVRIKDNFEEVSNYDKS